MTKIELSDTEAESFKAWRKHQETFEALLAAGIFGIKNGFAHLTFNQDGVLVLVRKEIDEWRRKKGYPQGRPLTSPN